MRKQQADLQNGSAHLLAARLVNGITDRPMKERPLEAFASQVGQGAVCRPLQKRAVGASPPIPILPPVDWLARCRHNGPPAGVRGQAWLRSTRRALINP